MNPYLLRLCVLSLRKHVPTLRDVELQSEDMYACLEALPVDRMFVTSMFGSAYRAKFFLRVEMGIEFSLLCSLSEDSKSCEFEWVASLKHPSGRGGFDAKETHIRISSNLGLSEFSRYSSEEQCDRLCDHLRLGWDTVFPYFFKSFGC